jgi:hypothetical protein
MKTKLFKNNKNIRYVINEKGSYVFAVLDILAIINDNNINTISISDFKDTLKSLELNNEVTKICIFNNNVMTYLDAYTKETLIRVLETIIVSQQDILSELELWLEEVISSNDNKK